MYTKEEQLKKVKKKKVSTFGKKNILKKKSQNLSKDEKDFLNWLQTRENTVCFVCGKNDFYDKIEWHHIKSHDPLRRHKSVCLRSVPHFSNAGSPVG